MNKDRLKHLIKRFRDRTITDKELFELKQYVKKIPETDDLLEEAFDSIFKETEIQSLPEDISNRWFNEIAQNIEYPEEKRYRFSPKIYIWSATACLLLLATFLFFYKDRNLADVTLYHDADEVTEILPGTSKGQVMLENGNIIDLESFPADSTLYLDGYALKKDKEGMLSYILEDTKLEKPVYNTITTPKGGEYKLSLPDGTEIWVNALSKVKYPLQMGIGHREVELEGEAYFKVANVEDESGYVPFIVYSGDQKLEVLGTVFNVNNYHSTIKTTLVEGQVKLSYQGLESTILQPNQQATFDGENYAVQVDEVDPFYMIAWKNGSFSFNKEDIYTVMETLARWYDVSVEYNSDVKEIFFTGTISKYEDIDKVLKIIEHTGTLRFEIEGRRVIVMK